MPKNFKSPLAASNFLDIWEYIAEDNIRRADRFVDTIDQKLKILADAPMMGRSRDELAPNLRSFPIGIMLSFTGL